MTNPEEVIHITLGFGNPVLDAVLGFVIGASLAYLVIAVCKGSIRFSDWLEEMPPGDEPRG